MVRCNVVRCNVVRCSEVRCSVMSEKSTSNL